jgi:hypothetical protein
MINDVLSSFLRPPRIYYALLSINSKIFFLSNFVARGFVISLKVGRKKRNSENKKWGKLSELPMKKPTKLL